MFGKLLGATFALIWDFFGGGPATVQILRCGMDTIMGHDQKRPPSRILAYSPQEDFSSVFTLLSSLHPNRFSTLGFLQATLSRESPTTNIYEHMTLPYNRAWVSRSRFQLWGASQKLNTLYRTFGSSFKIFNFWELPKN